MSNLVFPLSLSSKSPHLFPPGWPWNLLILLSSSLHLSISRPHSFSSFFLSSHWGRMGNISLSTLFSHLLSGNSDCRAVLLTFNKLLDPVRYEKPQLRLHRTKYHTNPGKWKVFSIITYYVCFVNQKHLRWIWLKKPQNIPKIGVTHAGSETHTVSLTRTHTGGLHCTIVSTGLFAGCFFSWPQLRKWISNVVLPP